MKKQILNKEICKKCINIAMEQRRQRNDHYIAFWSDIDDYRWARGHNIICPVECVPIGASIYDTPPDTCPYRIEHVLLCT